MFHAAYLFSKSSSGMDRVKNVLYDNVSPISQWVSSSLSDDEADKQTQLYSVEMEVGCPVSGPYPVGVTPLALFVCSVNPRSVKSERIPSRAESYSVSVNVMIIFINLYGFQDHSVIIPIARPYNKCMFEVNHEISCGWKLSQCRLLSWSVLCISDMFLDPCRNQAALLDNVDLSAATRNFVNFFGWTGFCLWLVLKIVSAFYVVEILF